MNAIYSKNCFNRNVASLPQNGSTRKPNFPLFRRMLQLEKDMLIQGWVEKRKIENVLNLINGAGKYAIGRPPRSLFVYLFLFYGIIFHSNTLMNITIFLNFI